MDGRAASQTITDKIPFIRKAGILPVVLSAPTGTRDSQFPHYQIFSPAPSGVLFEGRHIIKKRFAKKSLEKSFKALLTLICLPFLIIEKVFIQLDSQWSWALSASLKGRQLIERFKPELIYSTAGPPSTHAAGYFLCRVTGLPWLAEVHDPLIQADEYPRWHNYFFKKWLEKKIWSQADAVIYFTEKARQSAAGRNPGKKNAFVLRPGAGMPDLQDGQYQKRPAMHLGHFGSLADDRNLSTVIKALQALITENPAWKDILRLDVYGTEPDPVSALHLKRFPLPKMMNLYGRLEYDPVTGKTGRQQVVEAMCKTDVLLLIHGDAKGVSEYIPSKLYEYLFTGRPIVGLVSPGSELQTMLQETGHQAVDQHDIQAVKRVIAEQVARWQASGLENSDQRSRYTVDETVRRLITIANKVIR